MPTTVTKIVDPDNGGGTDYTSLSAGEAGEQQDLVSADRILVFECRSTSGTADSTNCVFSGWTTDATRYVRAQSSGANRHSGVWSTSKYRLTGSLELGANHYYNVVGLQISGAVFNSFAFSTFSHNIVRGSASPVINWTDGKASFIYNNLIVRVSGSGKILFVGSDTTTYVENNTIVNEGSGNTVDGGLMYNSGTVIARNNIVYGIVDDAGNFQFPYRNTFSSGTDYNTTESTCNIGTGSNNHISQTFTFTNAGAGDYSIASGDTGAKDKGSTLAAVSSGFTDDIIGTARPGSGAIDCGCFEFSGGGGGGNVFRYSNLSGLQGGGPFFINPLGA